MAHDFEGRPVRRASSIRLALSLLLTLGLGTSVGCGDDEDSKVAAGDGDGDQPAGDGDLNPGDGDGDVTPGDGDGDKNPLDAGGKGDAGGDGDSDAGQEPEPPAPLVQKFLSANALNLPQSDRLLSAAFGPNGLIYASGYITVERTFTGGPSPVTVLDRKSAVARFKLNGELDTTFGDLANEAEPAGARTGIATWNLVEATASAAESSESAKSLAVQSDGKIVFVGTAETSKKEVTAANPGGGDDLKGTYGDIDIFVARFTADGKPDTEGDHKFAPTDSNTDGVFWINGPMVAVVNASNAVPPVYTMGNPLNDDAYDIDVDSKDRIVVTTRSKAVARDDFDRYLVRLLKDGAPDANFGAAGFVAVNAPGDRSENARRTEILAGDELISAGYTGINGKNTMVIARLDASGAFVNSWGTNGILVLNPFLTDSAATTGICEAYDATQQSDGSFVTIGYGKHSGTDERESIYSIHLSATGELAEWNGDLGYYELSQLTGAAAANTGDENGRNVHALPDDRIVFVGQGHVRSNTDKDALVGLLTKDGRADTAFENVGHKVYDLGQNNDQFVGLAVSPDGKYVVAAGSAGTGNGNADDNSALVIFSIGE